MLANNLVWIFRNAQTSRTTRMALVKRGKALALGGVTQVGAITLSPISRSGLISNQSPQVMRSLWVSG